MASSGLSPLPKEEFNGRFTNGQQPRRTKHGRRRRMCRRTLLPRNFAETEQSGSAVSKSFLLTGIIRLLIEDGMLPKLEGKSCPICNKGILGKLQLRDSGLPRHRCNRKGCQKFVTPQHLHPLFTATRGPEGHSLQVQAMALLLLISNVPLSTIHILTKMNHKALERMWRSLVLVRKRHVESNEGKISCGQGPHWQDIEADEATFDKTVEDSIAHWEQWAGLVARGRPETLVLTRLTPPPTTARAPGPGAIRKVDWKPLANKWLVGKKVILHTDSARSYKAKVPGVLHDSVVHQKKRTKVRGKWVWKNPTFVKLRTHKLPNGKTIRRKAGTQIIDRAWRFIKDRLRLNQFTKVGSFLLRAQIRSAQYEYWHKGQDLWACTGQLLSNCIAGILA